MSDSNNMEARIRRLEANVAIRELLGKYAFAIDNRDWAALRQVFTKEAVLGFPAIVARGRDNIAETLSRAMEAMGPTMHVVNQHALEWHDDDTASGVSVGHAEDVMADGTIALSALRYLDRYAFEDGLWRIAERLIQTRYVTAAEEWPDVFRKELRKRWPGREPAAADF